jgi:alpha-mannosidase
LGQRYFQQAFSRTARTGYNVDSFGHAAGIPQLLQKAGINSYVMMRPGEREMPLPGPAFRWQDESGAQVTTYRVPFSYEATADQIADLVQDGAALSDRTKLPVMLFFGIGNHGGGPTEQTLAAIEEERAVTGRVSYGDPDTYFAGLTARGALLPAVRGELQHHAIGCYSVSAWVKEANARIEARLLLAEQAAAVACQTLGGPDQTQILSEAWKELAFCQFHDSLAGTASARAYRGIHAKLGYAEAIADRVATQALCRMAHAVSTAELAVIERENTFWLGSEGHGLPFFVYNPLSWPVRQPVVAGRSAGTVTNARGEEVASQAVPSGEVAIFPSHTLWTAELPPLGYEVFWLSEGRDREVVVDHRREPVIENEHLRVTIDEDTCALNSIVDKVTGRELLSAGGIRPVAINDASDTWSHGCTKFGGDEHDVVPASWEVVESGPVRYTLRLRFSCGPSSVREDVSLYSGSRFLEVNVHTEWSSPHVVLKLAFPWSLGAEAVNVAGAAYAVAQRLPTGNEEPMQGWVEAYDPTTDFGITVTTDHLYSYDASGSTVRITVLRDPLVADHGAGWAVRPGEDHTFTDSGAHTASLRVHPHSGDWRSLGAMARELEHRHSPTVIADTYHPGTMAQSGSFLRVKPSGGVLVTTVKRAEDGGGTVLRLQEQHGVWAEAVISGALLGREVTVHLEPYEIQSLFVPDSGAEPARVIGIAELDCMADGTAPHRE